MKVTPETMELAQKIDDYFLVHPERHDQIHWLTVNGSNFYAREIDEDNVCDSTMCIAGSAVFLSRSMEEFKKFVQDSQWWGYTAGPLLGLDDEEWNWLFYETTNEEAIDGVRAIANGDVDKFRSMVPEYMK